jgi:branched-chain amino acid aminotransferase
MNLRLFSLNGQIKQISEATVPALNIEYAYGFGVYETIRVHNGTAYFAKEHIERIIASAAIIGLEHIFNAAKIKSYIEDLIKQLNLGTYNLKVMLIGGKTKEDSLLYILPVLPLFPARKLYSTGVSVTTANYERPFPNAKTLSMLPSYLAFKKAREGGYYECLAINRDGFITEGTKSNFFLVKGNTIFTPTEDKILNGVTKRIVLDLALQLNFTIQNKNVRLDDISNYDSAFLTSTSSKVMPINKIGDYPYKIPEIVHQLQFKYDEYLKASRGSFVEPKGL